MAEIIKMPRLSDTMEEGVVAKWLKQVGDRVEEGDILAEIETDKATMEFESFYEGTLLHIGIQEGEGAPVDALLAIVGEEGEDISALLSGGGAEDSAAQPSPAVEEDFSAEEEDSLNAALEQATTAPAAGGGEIPEGVEIVKMPRLSDTMEEGTVASWLKKVGDEVEEGDILAEIETDKATMEFESFYSGTLLYIGIQEGESAPVDSVLAVIGPEGTDVDAVLAGGSAPAAAPAAAEAPASETSAPAPASPAATAAPVATDSGDRVFVSPLAKKMAEDKGIDLNQVTGSGDHGRIVKRDIESFVPAAAAPAPAPAPAATPAPTAAPAAAAPVALPGGIEGSREEKNSQMRKVIAKRLGESKFTAPHYYLTIEVEMDNAITSRAQMNNLPNTKISFNDMVLKACAMALLKHPQVNTSWNGDSTRYYDHVHMGVAVAVDEGLVVPVLKHADQMNLSQINAQVKDMAGRARDKKITPQEMEGSTFTVSNLGMFGIVEFTSIINQPNSAILSVGSIVQRPVVREGEIVVRSIMKLTLACDHRTVDGATGAQFLQTVQAYLENPVMMLA
jgi:pyruvate dehydrogenase E2 component (dihydrolipoamide acetyltransferase)